MAQTKIMDKLKDKQKIILKYRNIGFNKINEIIKNENISKVIENSIYNYTIYKSNNFNYIMCFSNELFRLTYKNKLLSLYLNINPKTYIKNNYLLPKILNNEINLNNIAFMEPQELCPEKWDDIIKKKKAKRELEISKFAGQITYMYTCSRCKNKKCSYYRLQTRSCDEPMTTFIKCMKCSKEWKSNS